MTGILSALSNAEIAYCAGVLLISYSLRGSSGFGSAIGLPLLALVIPVKILAPAWTLLGISSSLAILGHDRRHIAWRLFLILMPGCALGVALGLYWFKTVDAAKLAKALGIVVIAYGGYSYWRTTREAMLEPLPRRIVRPLASVLSGTVGTLFGAMSTIFFGIYLNTHDISKHAFRATMSAMLLVLSVVRGLAYVAVDEMSFESITVFIAALPAMLAGIFIGGRIHASIDDTKFKRLVCVTLALCGTALLMK